MIDLSGRPPEWPSEAVELWGESVRRATGRGDLWRVPAPRGDDLLREQLGEQLRLDPEHLTITASLRAAVLTYARRYRRFLIERPTYPGVAETAVAAGAEVAFQPWDELFEQRAPATAGTVVWLTAPCRNPDGADLRDPDRAGLARLAGSGRRVVVNGAYAWFSRDLRWPPGVDLAGTLHKLCGVGARLGWVYSRTYFDEAYPEMLATTPSRVWQHAWGLFLRDGGAALLRARLVDPSLQAAEAFGTRLRTAHGAALPAFTGTHAILPIATHLDEEAALAALAGRGFRLCPGSPFRCAAPALRVSFTGVGRDEAVRFADALVDSGVLRLDSPAEAVAG
jgi:DNA-binding transcriptional MocR family regulator